MGIRDRYMVPTGCSTPEKAVKRLDIMLTNKDMANLLMYGVEGSDYVIKDEAAGVVGYPCLLYTSRCV